MSIFSSQVTDVLTVPDGSGTITIRKLAPRHLERAAKAQQAASMADLRAMGGAQFLQEFNALSPADRQRAARPDPLTLFDSLTILAAGVTAWSYDAPVDEAHLADLDAETSDWLVRAILRLTKPSLFVSAADEDEARKNA